jgi:hypothetical protein
MKNTKILAVAICAVVLSVQNASAWEDLNSPRLIDKLGCHHVDGTCYVVLDGAAFGSTLGCSVAVGNEFRFDEGDSAIGIRSYASLLAAKLKGRSVNVSIDGCTKQGFPKLRTFLIN